MAIWETLKDAISAYTGLSPAIFFTVLAVALTFYYVVSGLFRSPTPPPRASRDIDDVEPLPPPVQLGEITGEDLKKYDGSDPKKPLLMAIKGQIYDVSQSRMFYGPGGPYALFAGRDASRALAKMSFEVEDLTGDISGLGAFELDALQDWEYKFMSKYVKVGTIKPEPAEEVADGNAPETTQSAAREVDTSSAPSGVENDTNSTNLVQSTIAANPVAPTTDANPVQSTIDANPVQPTIDANPVQSTIDANPVQPTIDANPVQSTIDANPVQSTIDVNPVQPTTDASNAVAVETTQVKEVQGNTN